MQHPQITMLLASERLADLRRDADVARLGREARGRSPLPARPPDGAQVALRIDRVSDRSALERLAELAGRALPAGPFVVTEVEGRVVAALPLGGGAPLADPLVATAHLLPLLELRAAQIRQVKVRPRPRRRLLPRRA